MHREFAEDVSRIAAFLAKRDVSRLSREALQETYGIEQPAVLLVFGNDLPYVAEAASKAFQTGIAEKMIFCGGIGHSTKRLRAAVAASQRYPWSLQVIDQLSEAEIYRMIACDLYQIPAEKILLDTQSANSGENAQNGLAVMEAHGLEDFPVILMQDPLLQRRAEASFRFYAGDRTMISYAPFLPVLNEDGRMKEEIPCLWDRDRMLELLFGEVIRLRDDENGYGPRGKGFIVHVEVPEEIEAAYARLKNTHPEISRDMI